jgi:hypothetical protein
MANDKQLTNTTMTLDKENFNFIKEMINNSESINSIKAFCTGFGIDIERYSSPVHISEDQISVTYRRKSYYVTYNHSRIQGTTYFNKIK